MRLFLVLLLALASCSAAQESGCRPPSCDRATVVVEQGDLRVTIDAEVADTPAERSRGLKERPSLLEGAGMLFLFAEARTRTFTMEDVLIPLDLLVLRDGRVVEVIEMVPCEPGAGTCLYPTLEADAAVEVPGGWAARVGVDVGATVSAEGLI